MQATAGLDLPAGAAAWGALPLAEEEPPPQVAPTSSFAASLAMRPAEDVVPPRATGRPVAHPGNTITPMGTVLGGASGVVPIPAATPARLTPSASTDPIDDWAWERPAGPPSLVQQSGAGYPLPPARQPLAWQPGMPRSSGPPVGPAPLPPLQTPPYGGQPVAEQPTGTQQPAHPPAQQPGRPDPLGQQPVGQPPLGQPPLGQPPAASPYGWRPVAQDAAAPDRDQRPGGAPQRRSQQDRSQQGRSQQGRSQQGRAGSPRTRRGRPEDPRQAAVYDALAINEHVLDEVWTNTSVDVLKVVSNIVVNALDAYEEDPAEYADWVAVHRTGRCDCH